MHISLYHRWFYALFGLLKENRAGDAFRTSVSGRPFPTDPKTRFPNNRKESNYSRNLLGKNQELLWDSLDNKIIC